jgi:hypothetical protein
LHGESFRVVRRVALKDSLPQHTASNPEGMVEELFLTQVEVTRVQCMIFFTAETFLNQNGTIIFQQNKL